MASGCSTTRADRKTIPLSTSTRCLAPFQLRGSRSTTFAPIFVSSKHDIENSTTIIASTTLPRHSATRFRLFPSCSQSAYLDSPRALNWRSNNCLPPSPNLPAAIDPEPLHGHFCFDYITRAYQNRETPIPPTFLSSMLLHTQPQDLDLENRFFFCFRQRNDDGDVIKTTRGNHNHHRKSNHRH